MTAPAGTPALWQQIAAALGEIDGAVAAVPTGGALGPDGTARLHQTVRGVLDALRAELVAALPERDAYEALFPLVLLFDERVTARLDERDAAIWPLLQRELYGVESGGDLFYDLADERVADPGRAPLTVAILLYCLRSGFVGKAADDPAEATRTADQLAGAVALPALSPIGPAPLARRAAAPHAATIYYLLSALIGIGVGLLILRA